MNSQLSRVQVTTVICSFVLVLAGCASYHVGNQSLFPASVESVYVPVFESSSLRRGLGEELTEAVIKEIERRTPYKVVGDPGADTILKGRITGDTKQLALETRTGDPRENQMGLTVQVRWTDRQGEVIREGTANPAPSDSVTISASSELVPETGESVATAQMQAIQRLARKIVDLMEAPW
ncbi:MAG: LptE family protein [Thermoguttaceae bacterium]